MPWWNQGEETEANEERQDVKEKDRQKTDREKDTSGAMQLSLSELLKFPKEDYTHTCPQAESAGAHVLCFISSFFFFCSFLSAGSLLSQRLRREVA